ncbi:UNVERIFIED_CONTAM: Retrovirus-related Pol polyprotein from type-2 retrotransposable element R2DM [Sesamum radiatum]|uniref:Retrovirus-related Pol polyprotein from type-2 retrotransposable element R2DM n=1 Tax=Sesamum radiatum TaxID=300843 RepID=A0AAW2JFH6_SESRA
MLVLIPKIHLPVRVSDFRPIACCNVLYKAITKILVRRMQQVLDLLIDYSQNAFVPGRSIADNILLAQELMAGYNQSRLPQRCTIKVDIQKAYDSVHWDFVLESLRIFNFPSRFISWIEQCLTTPTLSISLNGSVHGFFKGARGLRQGDPMSPYLFVLVMEIWHVLLTIRTRNEGSFQHHWKCNELGIVNLSFADDILIFCAGNLESVRMIKHTLAEFAEMSGLHVNPNKSTIILSKAVRSERRAILDLMGFPEAVLPIKYLGVPLIASRLTVADCQPLIDRFNNRLAVFILPKAVIKVIERRMRDFLWKGVSGTGYAKVSWLQVCKSKEEGGLGIRRVLFMNQALMLRHIWRILQRDPRSIWVAWVLRYRLRNQTLWTSSVTTAPWCWRKLIKLCPLLRDGLDYRVGDGCQFKLWGDIWHPRGPLLHSFPRGPRITGLPADAMLQEVIQQGQWSWPALTEFDIQEIVSELPPIYPNQTDEIKWKHNTGMCTTAALYSLLQPTSLRVGWHHLLSGKFKIPRHGFVLWLAILERLSTMDRIWAYQANGSCALLWRFGGGEPFSYFL